MTGLVSAWAMATRSLSEEYGPGVCLGDGQTKAEGVPSQGGRGDALLRRMPPYLTLLGRGKSYLGEVSLPVSKNCCSGECRTIGEKELSG